MLIAKNAPGPFRGKNAPGPFWAVAVLAMACVGAANAGSGAAGPAGGPGIVGSTVVPATEAVLKTPKRGKDGRRLQPGSAGGVMLHGEQLASVRNQLTSAEGVTIEGSVIRVPTTLAGGEAATIVLDTQSGQLLVVRN
jgi:hypothetical protein